MMISDDRRNESPFTTIIRSGSASLNVRCYVKEGGQTVILLHGGPGVPDEMTEVREFLSEKFQVIVFDQRGTGDSACGKCTFTIRDYLEDIDSIAQYFKIQKFYLFGHSWGGVYAQLYAQEFPGKISGLFLCSPGPGTGKAWKEAEREVLQYNWRRSTWFEFFIMAINSSLALMGSRSAYIRLFRQMIINYHKGYNVPAPEREKLEKINARASGMTRREIRNYTEMPDFGKTVYPVVITYGEFDAYGKSKRYILKRFPFCRVVIVPQSGHTPWKHNWSAFKTILTDFFISRQ